jgi:hypothetical protein
MSIVLIEKTQIMVNTIQYRSSGLSTMMWATTPSIQPHLHEHMLA